MPKKILLIIFDGLGDRPIKEFGGKTPLEAAEKPNLDFLAREGKCGTMNALPLTYYPTSEESHMAILGYDFIRDYPGRGVFDGLGAGVKLKHEEMIFRVDFATVDENLRLVDPRAGVIEDTTALCKTINNIEIDGITFNMYPTLSYRGALVLKGAPVRRYIDSVRDADVSDTDPRYPRKVGVTGLGERVHEPHGKGKDGKTVARALERYQYLTYQILKEHKVNKKRVKKGLPPANFVLTRGEGYLRKVDSFENKFGLKAACVAGAPMYKGIASYFGMKVEKVKGATGTIETKVDKKVAVAKKLFKKNDFVFLHLKGTDVAAEEFGDPKMKKAFIERADKAFTELLKLENTVIVVTGDHSTPCELKTHSKDPVPILVYGVGKDTVDSFGETSCKMGDIGHIFGGEVMKLLTKEAAHV